PVALLALYLGAIAREAARHRRWPARRIFFFAGGCALLLAALLPPVMDIAHHSLRGHMLQHLLLGMFAPLGLVLGAPGTLLLRTLPVRAARALMTFLRVRVVRVVIHPLTAALLDMGGMYLLYLTPLYALSRHDPFLHGFIHLH